MKYIINKHTLDNTVFTYLDIMLGDLEKRKPKYYEGIIFAHPDKELGISGWENDGTLHIFYELVDEISSTFGLQHNDSKKLIGRWVSDRFQLEVNGFSKLFGAFYF